MKQKAVIIDLDGTLVNNGVRALNHIQRAREHLTDAEIRWDEFFQETMKYDQPNPWCMEMVNLFSERGYKILFLTGRSGTKTTKMNTETWLTTYVGPGINYELIMRPENDFRKNAEVKLDLMMNKILPLYNVLFAVDDMKDNCTMFRMLGIPALQCADYGPH